MSDIIVIIIAASNIPITLKSTFPMNLGGKYRHQPVFMLSYQYSNREYGKKILDAIIKEVS